jgi:indolepyruvate ferredoxin oxidoreductase alpha subunit
MSQSLAGSPAATQAAGVPPAGVSHSTVLLGDEAVALGALHAGVGAAYGYPGTPSTEIFEYLFRHGPQEFGITAHWCANEKTAYEQALGVSMAGRRAIVTMKHVGLNVAADPFVNSALLGIRGGLVVVVADDPGMHSSQNEQDSRWMADFARVPCLEPASQQEAYEMVRSAFGISERFRTPVMLRLVTRLCHSRAEILPAPPDPAPVPPDRPDSRDWTLLPANARRLWGELVSEAPRLEAFSASSPWNGLLTPGEPGISAELVITTGLARGYLEENLERLPSPPRHLHLGLHPIPRALLEDALDGVSSVLVLEDGYPYVERLLAGLIPGDLQVRGRLSGDLPPTGELDPDVVGRALGLPEPPGVALPGLSLPGRPPQLCKGCPHGDAFRAVNMALEEFDAPLVAGDIGCYTLGALPPYDAIQSCVCMGASIGMAKGAADAGVRPVMAVIGDSTFLHSGVTPLIDAVAHDTPITVLILDNETVAMTGQQPTVLPDSRLAPIIRGVGVDPDHFHVVETHPRMTDELAGLIRSELVHEGLSVILAVRECIVAVRQRKSREREGGGQ